MLSRLLLAIALIVTCGCGSGKGDPAKEPPADKPGAPLEPVKDPHPTISIAHETTLFRAYAENEAAADAKFLGRKVEFMARGKVQKDESGRYVILADADSPACGVLCRVLPAHVKSLAKAKPDMAFKVRGVCRGKMRERRTGEQFWVEVSDCEIISLLEYVGNDWRNVKGAP